MKVAPNQETRPVWIEQPEYAMKLSEKFGMENAEYVKTPVSSGTHLRNKKMKMRKEQTIVNTSRSLEACSIYEFWYTFEE